MIYLMVVLFSLMIVGLLMAFISDDNGVMWIILFVICLWSLFFSALFYIYNHKYDLKITDVNGKEYVYKKVHGVTDDKSGTVSFTTKSGERLSYRVSSMTQTSSK